MEVEVSGSKPIGGSRIEGADSEKDPLRVKRKTLEAVHLQCQRALELINNTGCVDNDDRTDGDADGAPGEGSSGWYGDKETDEGPESEKLAAASRLEDDVNFYQTVNPDVAKLFHMDPDAKRPALVLLKKEAEKLSHFDGQFLKSAIAEFVSASKLALVTTFTRESAPVIFESPIKKQLLLFTTSNDSEKVVPTFEEAAQNFKGKLIFVYVEMDNEDVGRPVAEYFGVTGNSPQVIGFSGNDDGKKYIFTGEVTLDKIKAFGEDFLQDKLKPFYKSDPIPETNDGDVKIVVGNNFDEIVLDESKDVLLELYAPWCGHCQALEATYNKLAKHLRGIESLIVAKMDGTTNEHPRAKMPTLWVVSSLLPIVGGVALASMTEASFNWAGFWSAMASNLTNQSRNVLSKKFMVKKEDSLDNITLFSIITIMSFILLAPVTIFVEGVKFTSSYLQFAGLNVRQVYIRSFLAALCFHAYQQTACSFTWYHNVSSTFSLF